MPKISEQIAVHLSKDQLLDVIKDEVNHLREELDCGINDGVGEWRPIKPKEIIRRAEQIERLGELLPR